MNKQHNALQAGLFITACVILIIVILVAIKGVGTIFEPMSDHIASFSLSDNIGGLRIGDHVRVGGFDAGTVKSIQVVDAEAGATERPHIRIRYSLPRRFLVHEDAKLEIETTVTGTSVLNFVALGTGPALKPGEELAGRPGALQTIMASLSSAGPQLNGLLHDVRSQTLPRVDRTIDKYASVADSFHAAGDNASKLIDQIHQEIDPIVKRYEEVVSNTNIMLGNVSTLFSDVKRDVRGTAANLNATTATLNQELPGILKQVNDLSDQLNTTIAGINDSLGDIRQTIVNARQLTGSARDILVENKTRINDMIDSLKKTADSLRATVAEIRRSPWRLLYKPKPGEMANLNIFDSARQFAQGADSLSDAASALRDALSLPNPDQKQIHNLMQQLNLSFEHFQSVEKKLWQSVKD